MPMGVGGGNVGVGGMVAGAVHVGVGVAAGVSSPTGVGATVDVGVGSRISVGVSDAGTNGSMTVLRASSWASTPAAAPGGRSVALTSSSRATCPRRR
ncbi:MAG: hypothetical protein R2838_23595 [Caldilineaceae bacterium]